jgi:cob(I)alamin adenosyltransferase
MKIYTRTGDDGSTSLFSGERVPKTDLRVKTYGTIDELNSQLGAARAFLPHATVEEYLVGLQNQLFIVGADLATIPRDSGKEAVRIKEAECLWLETEIDLMTSRLPTLRNFILPGGSPAAAHIHIARSICRRAERQVLDLSQREPVNKDLLIYLNRLSDFLFTLARYENMLKDINEAKWSIKQ